MQQKGQYVSPAQQGKCFRSALRLAKDGLHASLVANPEKLSDEERSVRYRQIREGAVMILALQEVLRTINIKNWSTADDLLGEKVARENARISSGILARWGVQIKEVES